MNISGKVCLVTGASSGIGEATARLLTKNGTKVILVARNKDKLDKISGELHDSLVVPADMTKPREIKNMIKIAVDYFGRIDILINNAGRGYDTPVEFANPKIVAEIFNLDFLGPLIAMQEVIPVMKRLGGGMIVNISSGTVFMTLPNNGPYSAIKQALATLSLTAREELKKDYIIVSVVYPYMTETDFEKNTLKTKVMPMTMEGGFKPPPADSPEYIAGKILEVIKTEQAEMPAHEWMKNFK